MAFTCQILFENYSNEVFYSGESINGAVKIAAEVPVTVKSEIFYCVIKFKIYQYAIYHLIPFWDP